MFACKQCSERMSHPSGHEEIAVCVSGDLLHGLASELGQVAIERELVVQDLVGLDLNVSSLPLGTTLRLVDHDARVCERVALALQQAY